jgi:hypothetical protein
MTAAREFDAAVAAAVAYTATLRAAREAVCACGERRYPTQAEAHEAEPEGRYKCPTCHTFALDHPYFEGGEGRCGDCDTRYHSHGGPR